MKKNIGRGKGKDWEGRKELISHLPMKKNNTPNSFIVSKGRLYSLIHLLK